GPGRRAEQGDGDQAEGASVPGSGPGQGEGGAAEPGEVAGEPGPRPGGGGGAGEGAGEAGEGPSGGADEAGEGRPRGAGRRDEEDPDADEGAGRRPGGRGAAGEGEPGDPRGAEPAADPGGEGEVAVALRGGEPLRRHHADRQAGDLPDRRLRQHDVGGREDEGAAEVDGGLYHGVEADAQPAGAGEVPGDHLQPGGGLPAGQCRAL